MFVSSCMVLVTQDIANGCNLVTLDSKATADKDGDTVYLKPEDLSEPGYELPTINPQNFGKKYRYYYCSGMYDPGPFRNSIMKVDTTTKNVMAWRENEFTYPGEVQFVGSPGSSAEDDGILLAAVTDVRKDEPDFLIVLDATTFKEIARAEVTIHIPNVIHGIFLPQTFGNS
ncbi:unnamed protein product [Timema podura]|uniref:Carotenoid cleavage dioxygenase n=1 Tax=Timema podura TaxID=61482 RepID=A0ABN7PRI3_TIMPD|nr:unnamed protein product [Timema podura]